MRNRSTTLPGKMTRAEADHGVGLTDTRRKVFELVIKAGQPVGAYRLLEAMQDKGTRVMPPTVYRALNFLQGKGLVHRIESLNAFVACTQHEHEHEGQFLICSDCGKSEELADESVSEMLREKAEAHGFTLTQQTIELRGLCKDCASE
jgi:Fur family transcriptional regulator, zinc uptake regulator